MHRDRHTLGAATLFVAAASIVLLGCGSDATSVNAAAKGTDTATTIVTCQVDHSELFTVTPATDADAATVKVSAEEVVAMMSKDANPVEKSELVRLTMPESLDNGPPATDRYEPGQAGNPGRTENRLVWQFTQPPADGSLVEFYGPGGHSQLTLVPDPASCQIDHYLTFVDAETGWPIGTVTLLRK